MLAVDRADFERLYEAGELKSPLDTISAAELQRKDIPPVRFVVDGLLPAGLNIIASPPKFGKSWMMLDLCLAVSTGDRFLGYKTRECSCLYLALEDSPRRLKSRMNKLLNDRTAPDVFFFATSAHTIDNGLFAELEEFFDTRPDTGLIVIDTLQRIRGAAQGREGAYASDYRETGALKSFADKHNVALLLVHHLRKMRDDGDPFNQISGTTGILGAADTAIVLTREKRGASDTTMSITGRDVDSRDLVITFNKASCRWENIGDAEAVAEERAFKEYHSSPITLTVKKLLEQSPRGWSGSAKQLMDAGEYIAHTSLALTAQDLSKKLKAMSASMLEYDGIVYERRGNGTGGGKHSFRRLEENNPFLEG